MRRVSDEEMMPRLVEASTLFVTEEFRSSPWIARLTKKVGKVWVTDHEPIKGHFGTYFGSMYRRRYENPWIQDLYHLHELTHVRRTKYDPNTTYDAWHTRVLDAEFEASLASECEAYLRIPTLRAKTFPHVIWIDRFLNLKEKQHLLEEPVIQNFMMMLREERERALHSPKRTDFLEAQIANYARQNLAWCEIWSETVGTGKYADEPAFRVVERHMASPDRDETHLEWLEALTPLELGDRKVPFSKQAEAFDRVYKESNRRYGNHRLLR